ncbi:RNA polymerase sigma factor [Amycolatopsis minnesotensis]|uniref:RNA polymerase sigma factor n=1 Tax=Amycolatopsis minnesotensis TaxID=337894 RepID=A0ABN2RVR5_9PSEU
MPGEELGDAELWSRAAAGDEDAFGDLFERHAQAVWNHAYRLTGSWATAEDLASATFLIAWRRRGEVTLVRESALPWLYTVAGNLARSEFRSAGRRLRLLNRVPAPADEADHADAVVDRMDSEERLRQAIDAVRRLPKSQRKAVELCLLGDLSIGDAAEALGISETTVRVHLSRARARLRKLCEEELS